MNSIKNTYTKKAWFCILLLFVGGISFSQTYRVAYTASGFVDDGGGSEQLVVENTNTGQSSVLVTTNCVGSCPDYNGIRNVPFKPDRIFIRLVSNGVITGNGIITYPGNSNCTARSFNLTNQNGVPTAVTVDIEPNVSISTPQTSPVGTCDGFNVSASPNFPSNVYRWEYRLGSSGPSSFNAIPGTDGMSSLNLTLADLPGATINQSINVRLRKCSFEFTNILIFSFIPCSPEINSITPITTTCSYTQDGSFNVNFDRALESESEEKLVNVSLRWAGPDGVLNTTDDVSPFDFIYMTTYSGTQFTWPNGLPSGLYLLSYQSQIGTDPPSTAIFSSSIVISAPSPLEYSVAVTSDLDCFDSNDGQIQITINPNNNGSIGTPFYAYTINNGTPVSFTGPSVTLSNLEPGSLQFKVFDSNNCTERQ